MTNSDNIDRYKIYFGQEGSPLESVSDDNSMRYNGITLTHRKNIVATVNAKQDEITFPETVGIIDKGTYNFKVIHVGNNNNHTNIGSIEITSSGETEKPKQLEGGE